MLLVKVYQYEKFAQSQIWKVKWGGFIRNPIWYQYTYHKNISILRFDWSNASHVSNDWYALRSKRNWRSYKVMRTIMMWSVQPFLQDRGFNKITDVFFLWVSRLEFIWFMWFKRGKGHFEMHLLKSGWISHFSLLRHWACQKVHSFDLSIRLACFLRVAYSI